jgi:threonine dehydratase
VIAGQGTIGMEILRQRQGPLDAIFVAIGGGGLIGGIAAYVKRVRPDVKIIGVQPNDSDAMARSLEAGAAWCCRTSGFLPTRAVKQVGRRRSDSRSLRRRSDSGRHRRDLRGHEGRLRGHALILEPAGALTIAGVKAWVERHRARERDYVAIACGANMNFDRLRFVAERAELGEQREAILAVTIPERPGSFREFCALLGNRNVTEFNYRYADPKIAHLFVGIEVRNRQEIVELLRELGRRRIEASDLSDNEMAKLHVRHLVGGHAPNATDEILYRFEFPERPGALMRFLDSMSAGWNISLFHYRNHGADYGRVLVGMQVPSATRSSFRRFLDRLGYDYVEETGNPAYRMFPGPLVHGAHSRRRAAPSANWAPLGAASREVGERGSLCLLQAVDSHALTRCGSARRRKLASVLLFMRFPLQVPIPARFYALGKPGSRGRLYPFRPDSRRRPSRGAICASLGQRALV